ncbi:unnamed protein product [Acanthocheilonema viteae]|uniref:VWFA domain-containing protein n=1 Tax=Acanthocheilonema viteae TaxID=6277 RepID=A0A498SM75_ACAVI|nr:unnamed protein product [Acanthocheilonema viteae]
MSNNHHLSSTINNEEVTFINDGLNAKAEMAQNPLKTFNSLLRDDFSHNNNENSRNLQSTNIHNAKGSSITSTGKTVRADLEEAKNLEKILFEEIDPTLYKSNVDTLSMIDENTYAFDRRRGAIVNLTGREIEFLAPTHIINRNLNLAGHRTGNLASSHIVDYSAFLTNSPSMKTSTVVPDFEISPSATTAISISGKEMLLKQTPAITMSQQNSASALIDFSRPQILDEYNYSNKFASSTTQTSAVSWITESVTDLPKTVIFSPTDHTTIPDGISSFHSFSTSTTTSSKPGLIIFPNRKNSDGSAYVGIKLSPPALDDRSSETKIEMPNSGRTLVENITEPKNNSGNGTLYSRPMPPVNFIRIGDREILDEQWSQSKASPVHPMPRISVGERIDRLQETQPSDSSEAEAMFVAREAIVKSASSYRSAEVPQETQFRKPFQVEFNSNDKIILPDLTIREDKITPPGIFFIPEHDSVTSEPDYIESMDSSFLNTDTLFTASEQEKSEALKSEFRTSINTQLPENIQFTRSQELSSDPIGFKVMNDEPSLIQTTSEINVNELIDCDIIAFDEDKCPIENDKSDQTQSDVLFLIGVSHNISEIHFQQSLKLIMDTVEQFKNIGSNGIQISLVQFAREAVLEFSFHKHNCKPCLLADIADTKCISGLNTTDNAINKIIKYGFSKRRGDRDEAANILVVVSNGLLDGQFHEALQLLHPNNITMMIVSTTDNTNHQLTKQFVNDDKYHNLFFDATTVDSDQLSDHLAGLIRTISKGLG